jgi:hypothetical protein
MCNNQKVQFISPVIIHELLENFNKYRILYKILCNDGVPAQFSKLIFPLGVITVYELKMFTTEPIMSADSQCLSTWIKEE